MQTLSASEVKQENETPKPKAITVQMVRKRAEHNEGVLDTLEEVAMHQDEIGVITNVFERCCPHLRIIYLQNNYIEKMQHLTLLHELEYLNLALNNISIIEGLDGCEKLNKLDLTMNFIIDITTVQSLRKNKLLRELYLIGNPCDKFKGYREFVIAALPQLHTFDGKDITAEERIQSARNFPSLLESMIEQADHCETGHYTPEERLKAWEELEETKKANSPKEPQKPDPFARVNTTPPAPPIPKEGERVIQGNQGHWKFVWYAEGDKLCLEVAINRYLDTSQIAIDPNPTWIRIEAKKKVMQLQLPCEVDPTDAIALRSQTTGNLVVKMTMTDPHHCPVAPKSQVGGIKRQ